MADDSGEALVRRYYEEALNPGASTGLTTCSPTTSSTTRSSRRRVHGPPARPAVRGDLVGIFRIANGRIAEHWGVFDQLAMLGQLGAFGG